jgi:hypothetical protein
MLNKIEFEKIPFFEKVKKIYFEGEFVVSIRYYEYKINLYLYNDFYVEVFYDHKMDRIDKIEILSYQPSRIKFYADQIKLPSDLKL